MCFASGAIISLRRILEPRPVPLNIQLSDLIVASGCRFFLCCASHTQCMHSYFRHARSRELRSLPSGASHGAEIKAEAKINPAQEELKSCR
ncbi:hypothetical protein IE4872_CH03569 [Rhizobium gallicum]|uniref:Uncharacterized protein n=1 Tax=Rhizobium gallicum TaxID=56730 RepID=A0A1L5NMN3_9HYPH|nr:hypothetical protein IE4872_CH03569 [Rhizobium gallicum]